MPVFGKLSNAKGLLSALTSDHIGVKVGIPQTLAPHAVDSAAARVPDQPPTRYSISVDGAVPIYVHWTRVAEIPSLWGRMERLKVHWSLDGRVDALAPPTSPLQTEIPLSWKIQWLASSAAALTALTRSARADRLQATTFWQLDAGHSTPPTFLHIPVQYPQPSLMVLWYTEASTDPALAFSGFDAAWNSHLVLDAGYRDVNQLQIQDESAAMRLKAERQKARAAKTENTLATPAATTRPHSPKSETSSSSDEAIDIPMRPKNAQLITPHDFTQNNPEQHSEQKPQHGLSIPLTLKHNADEVGVTYFFKQFTADNGHWTFLRRYETRSALDPVLDLAIKACGIAALDNVQPLFMGREYSRSIYAQALRLLHGALRDPKRCRSDESLMAVLMLGYFENLTCDGRESIQSWKAHIRGAMQLLQLRGKNQFKSVVGQLLFREIRAQILIYTIWDDLDPPSFLRDWNQDLQFHSASIEVISPADELSLI
ncbi:uncharacterized protein MYCFIDRAFT_174550 [Pseudocercospora fijiensis CIRAD86]|uniref:Uncharacterized protein n=1 Tax=Pseudocercospora fijiensis (strain CIRAD86) TaxID=383855 RepID=M2ZVP6_PSEFD|nr:uncharacterized protein MYCFIDRAFT_174550 [Pseudocercospora fijiensis CIRAD86]EME83069.1 hypothetical protein MYCFIDRAFT_174550 [Pseudocercospora fijiensis CIRAD86]